MFELSSCAKAAKRDNYGTFDYILTDNTAQMTNEFANKRTSWVAKYLLMHTL